MTKCVTKISPIFNRMAIFTVTDDAFHGHPEKIGGDDNTLRYALQLVYYTREKGPLVRNDKKISKKLKRKVKTYKFPHSAVFQPNCDEKSELIRVCETYEHQMFAHIPGSDKRACECNVRS